MGERRRRPFLAAMGMLALVACGNWGLQAGVSALARANLYNADFSREHRWLPSDHGIPYEEVSFTADGLRLAGWWMPGDGGDHGDTTIVLVHGLGSTMGKPVHMWGSHLHGLGYSLLAFDLRNHGASDDGAGGYVTYGTGESLDVLAAITWVRESSSRLGVDPERIVLYGGSMGAATVLQAAATRPEGVVAVISDTAYSSLREQARDEGRADGWPRWIVDRVVRRMDGIAPVPPTLSDPALVIGEVHVPLLLTHCTNDGRIPVSSLDRLLDGAPPGTPSWREPCTRGTGKAHHIDGWMEPSYNATVRQFLTGLPGPP